MTLDAIVPKIVVKNLFFLLLKLDIIGSPVIVVYLLFIELYIGGGNSSTLFYISY